MTFVEDPYRHYERLRRLEPKFRRAFGGWVVARDAHVRALLRSSDASVDRRLLEPGRSVLGDIVTEAFGDRMGRGQRALPNLDPPDHTRVRRLLASEFTGDALVRVRHRTEVIVDEVLDEVEGTELEVIDALALTVPFTIICELLGLPTGSTRDELRGCASDLIGVLVPHASSVEAEAAAGASDHLRAHLADVIAARQRAPQDDLISRLVAFGAEGRLTPDEVIDQVNFLFLGGFETTVNLIGNGILAIAQHPDQAEIVRRRPALLANATEEILRWDSPVQFGRRILRTELEFGSATIPAGSLVLACIGAANRDPALWGPTADAFDVTRVDAHRHLAFGTGIHHCVGAGFSRVEAEVTFGGLLRRYDSIELAAPPVRTQQTVLRGVSALHVALQRKATVDA